MRKQAAALLVLLLLLAGCSLYPGQNTNPYYDAERMKYFQGYNGVEAMYGQFPPRLYYYGNAPGSTANDFPFSVQIQNRGASYTRGAVFVSGYDPSLIEIDQIPITKAGQGACTLRLGDYSLNTFGMFFQCGENFQWSGQSGDWLKSISVRGKTWFSDSILSKMIVNYQHTNSGDRVDFTLDKNTFTYDQREHGILLIGMLAGLSFQRFLGQEYLLAGNTYDYPGGEMDYIDYTGHIVTWPQGTDEIPQTFQLTSCYMYTTFAAPMVCIDPQPYSENRKVCTPQAATWSNGQGAPVAVTQVTQENTPRTAAFHITVRDVGGGTVFDPGQLEKCSPYFPGGAKPSDQNVIWIGEVRIGDQLLTCSPAQELRLQNGQVSFTCTYPIQYAELNSAYQTPLVIELWYGYSKVTQQLITVKRVT
jgi:hypothetical protein